MFIISHYDNNVAFCWACTRDHDVSQNREALLRALGEPFQGKTVLEFRCVSGRDIAYFQHLGLHVEGLLGGTPNVCV
jgi:hypothetical protein